MLIWNTADRTQESYFTKTLNGARDDSILANEMAEIEALVAKHNVIPKFTDIPSEMTMGSSITIQDVNEVLSNSYRVDNVTGGTVTKNGNNLTITATSTGDLSFDLVNDGNRYSEPIKLYYAVDSQYVIETGSIDPIRVKFTTNVVGGKIRIKKVDVENNSTTAQGMASLVGAKYNVKDSNGQVVSTLTIGSDYTATTDYLPLGDYTIQEVSPSTGYTLDTTVYNAKITSSDILDVTVKEQVIKGKVKLYKYDSDTKKCISQGKASLKGAVYEVLNSQNVVVDTITIGDDCSAETKYLPYDNYTIREKSSSKGYKLDSSTYTIEIRKNETMEQIVYEQVIKGKFQVLKKDKDNMNFVASGQALLIGAKYGVYNSKDELVDTLIIGENFKAISKNLPYDDYKIKEIEAPKGYTLDPTVYSYAIKTDGSLQDIISSEKVIENWISILKQYDYVDGNTTFLNAESGIQFEIYYPNGTLYDTITTDKNGYATIKIPYGVWKFHQVNTNTGFEKIYDFFITVDENSEKEQYYNVLNNKLSAYLQLFKRDKETGKVIAIADTTFKILNTDTNEYVSQYVGGKVYSEFKTDNDGRFITYLKLEAGNYKLVEISSPVGYLLDEDGMNFTIGENSHYNYTTYGAVITFYFDNNPIKARIEIYKDGETFTIDNATFNYNNRKSLKGIVYNIYAEEDIKTSDGNTIYYEKDKLIETVTTNEAGYAISKKLPLGKYYVVEISTNPEYLLDETIHHVELQEKDNKTPIIYETIKITNILKKGTLEFTKTDLVTGDVIPNTKIEIYTEKNKLIYSGITDEKGKIVIEDLKIGKYYIIETEPATGYVLTEEKVYFEILEDGEIAKAEMTNKPITGKLDFTKVDFSTSKPLPNTKIEIYTENDELIYSGITDKKGKIVIDELRYGRYYILEKEAPKNYILNEEKMYFEILENGEIVKTTMTNEGLPSTLEFTKTDLVSGDVIPNTKIEIYTENDELVYSGVTDENGKIVIDTLKIGKYYIIETEPATGYVLTEEKVYFEVKEYNEIVKAEMTNKPITGKLDFTKLDFSTGKPIPNTLIEIYSVNDEENPIFSGRTDELGKIVIDELRYGKYFIVEKETASPDYILNTERMYFEILEDGKVVKCTMFNELAPVPDTDNSDYSQLIISIAGSVLMIIGIGVIVYDKKKRK